MSISIGYLSFAHAAPSGVADAVGHSSAQVEKGPSDIFERLTQRRLLAPGEDVVSLVVTAAQKALARAHVSADQIDRLYGTVMPSEYVLPNCLFRVHQSLGLSADCQVIPVEAGFAGFIKNSQLAAEAVLLARASRVLVVCGSGLSRHVVPNSPAAQVVGDGAGAAVVGASEQWVFIDYLERTFTGDDDYHGMTLSSRMIERGGTETYHADERGLPIATFEIDERGARSFAKYGLPEPPRLASMLLKKHHLRPSDVTLVSHQGSKRLMEHWASEIGPRAHLLTMDRYGDPGVASIPMTLSERQSEIDTDWVVFLAPSPGAHFAAMLIRR
ncbi:MAG: hypothetical protein IPK82_14870 [Polyangiaceae bacterium]|nr:hypothetical protein [Polyangiaceae bacterium]